MRRLLRTLVIFFGVLVLGAFPAGAAHAGQQRGQHDAPSFTFALLGDTPHGNAQRAIFPGLVEAVPR